MTLQQIISFPFVSQLLFQEQAHGLSAYLLPLLSLWSPSTKITSSPPPTLLFSIRQWFNELLPSRLLLSELAFISKEIWYAPWVQWFEFIYLQFTSKDTPSHFPSPLLYQLLICPWQIRF
jgi:hypothetical protein